MSDQNLPRRPGDADQELDALLADSYQRSDAALSEGLNLEEGLSLITGNEVASTEVSRQAAWPSIRPHSGHQERRLAGAAETSQTTLVGTRDVSDSVTWLTQEAYDRLKGELDHLSGPGRSDIAKKIEAAREEGDLRENSGYHAAKDEQGQIEARIILLQHILENARVGGPPRTDGVVGPGMTVTIRFVKDDDEVTFLLASREESGAPIDVYSPKSPLGSAIMGKKVGEKATYSLPNGRANTVEILEAVPYVGA